MQIKRITALFLAAVLSLSLAACGNSNTDTDVPNQAETQAGSSQTTDSNETRDTVQETESNNDKKNSILVLYFSVDNTKDVDAISSATPMTDGTSSVEWIANIIHDTVGGDLIPIIPSENYPLEYNELADYAKDEADNDGRPAFEDLGVDPTSYQTVFIGYPIWWYTTPKIMETLFETYDFSGVTIIPFNTHAGSRDGGTYSLIKEREPGANVLAGLAVRGEDAGKEDARSSVEAWLAGLDLE